MAKSESKKKVIDYRIDRKTTSTPKSSQKKIKRTNFEAGLAVENRLNIG